MSLQAQPQLGYTLTKATATSGDADSKGSMFVKVSGHDGNAGYKKHACSDAEANTLSEEGLVVSLHPASCHRAEDNEEGPHADEGVNVPRIEKGPGQCADKQEKEALY